MTKYKKTIILFALERKSEYSTSLQLEIVNNWKTVSKDRTKVLNVALYSSSETSPSNKEKPRIVKVYWKKSINKNIHIIYSNAFPNTYNKNAMNFRDRINLEILRTLKALNTLMARRALECL